MLTTRRRGRSFALLLLAVVLASACRADFEVRIDVEEDGSGLVMTELVLDQEAADRLLDLGEEATLPLSDLAQAGWEIGRPARDANGETRITAQKAFGTPEQFGEVMNDLTGGEGTFRDWSLRRDQAFGRVDYTLSGVIDPTESYGPFSDPDLETALGRSVGAIASSAPYNVSPEDVTFTVIVDFPGQLQDEGSIGAVSQTETGSHGEWRTDLAGQRVEVGLSSTRRSTSAQVLRGVAIVAIVLAALVAFAQLLRIVGSRRRRAAAPKPRPADARGRPTDAAPAPEPEPRPLTEQTAGYRVVALDGMGVLYREGDDIRRLLVPFARERGSTATDEEIADKARLLSLGRMTPSDFWHVIGVAGDPNELDSTYLAKHQLSPGVVRYLRALRNNGIRAACITNDAAAWAMQLRKGHSLDGLIDPWVVSGSVGVRKPEQPLFEVLRRVTGEAPANILLIDDDLDNLDAARDLGFGTRWFSADGERSEARGHEVLRGFEGFNPVDTLDIVPPDDGSSGN